MDLRDYQTGTTCYTAFTTVLRALKSDPSWSQSVYHVACAPLAVRLLGVRSDAQTQPGLGFRASGSRIRA